MRWRAAIGGMLDAPARWRAATRPAADRIKAAFGEDVVCAEVEKLYSEMVLTS